MKVALYARVSTRDKQNPEVQMRELREYASKRGWEVAGEYIDKMSGTKDSRPQLDAMMKRRPGSWMPLSSGSWTGSDAHFVIS